MRPGPAVCNTTPIEKTCCQMRWAQGGVGDLDCGIPSDSVGLTEGSRQVKRSGRMETSPILVWWEACCGVPQTRSCLQDPGDFFTSIHPHLHAEFANSGKRLHHSPSQKSTDVAPRLQVSCDRTGAVQKLWSFYLGLCQHWSLIKGQSGTNCSLGCSLS